MDLFHYNLRYPAPDPEDDLPERYRAIRQMETNPPATDIPASALQRIRAKAERLMAARERRETVLIFLRAGAAELLLGAMLVRGLRAAGLQTEYLISREISSPLSMTVKNAAEIELTDADLVVSTMLFTSDNHAARELEAYGMEILCLKEEADSSFGYTALPDAVSAYSLLCELFGSAGLRIPEDLQPFAAMAMLARHETRTNEYGKLITEGLEWKNHSVFPCFRCLSADQLYLFLNECILAEHQEEAMQFLLTDDSDTAEGLVSGFDSCSYFQEILDSAIEYWSSEQSVGDVLIARIPSDCMGKTPEAVACLAEKLNRVIILRPERSAGHRTSRTQLMTVGFPSRDLLEEFEETVAQSGSAMLLECSDRSAAVFSSAGKTVDADQELITLQLKQLASGLSTTTPAPLHTIDLEIGQDELIPESWNELQSFGPFASDAPEPLFLCRNLKLLKLSRDPEKPETLNVLFGLSEFPGETIEGVGMDLGDFSEILPTGISVDAVCRLRVRQIQEEPFLFLDLEQILHEPVYTPGSTLDEDELYLSGLVTIPEILEEYSIEEDLLIPTAAELNKIYRCLQQIHSSGSQWMFTDISLLTPLAASRTGMEISPFKMARALDILSEAGAIEVWRPGAGRILLRVTSNPRIRPLSQTTAYRTMMNQLQNHPE